MRELLTYFIAIAICAYGLFYIIGGPSLANQMARRGGRLVTRVLVAVIRWPFAVLSTVLRRVWQSRQQQTKW